MVDGPIAAYRALTKERDLRPDPAQELAAEKLQSLYFKLTHYARRPRSGWRVRLGIERRAPPPKGLYFFGGTGRGKTMLMDLFFESIEIERKRRAHFHAFMLDVHQRIHQWRQTRRDRDGAADPIPPLAAALADEAWLLCFDEFEVLDVADAMIMARLFGALFEAGVVVVATSNRAPDQLYLDGLQREQFLPFIDLMQERLDVLQLDGGTDYRLFGMRDMQVYFHPDDATAGAALDQAYERLAGHAEAMPVTLKVQGRELEVARANQGIARFSFEELCDRPLGAADYLAIAAHFHTLILSGVPKMTPEQRNQARRFATLVDILYEHRVKLICSAADLPDALYQKGTGTFEFRRTASRLMEMQGEEYLTDRHMA